MSEPFSLADKVAIVTGAGSGLGRATAQALGSAGATVVCADVTEEGGAATAAMLEDAGGKSSGRVVDVADAAAVTSMVADAVDRHGRLDVMCNIAGIMVDGAVLDVTEDDLDSIVRVNLKGVLFGCQAAARVMVAQGSGSIVNMSSTAAFAPSPGIAAYAMAKAAVLALTRSLAVEIGRQGVRVNAVAPGFVPTNMTSRYYRREDGTVDPELEELVLRPMRKLAPLGRVGLPEDIAHCVLFLASDASSFMTGQCLSPNGGMTML